MNDLFKHLLHIKTIIIRLDQMLATMEGGRIHVAYEELKTLRKELINELPRAG